MPPVASYRDAPSNGCGVKTAIRRSGTSPELLPGHIFRGCDTSHRRRAPPFATPPAGYFILRDRRRKRGREKRLCSRKSRMQQATSCKSPVLGGESLGSFCFKTVSPGQRNGFIVERRRLRPFQHRMLAKVCQRLGPPDFRGSDGPTSCAKNRTERTRPERGWRIRTSVRFNHRRMTRRALEELDVVFSTPQTDDASKRLRR